MSHTCVCTYAHTVMWHACVCTSARGVTRIWGFWTVCMHARADVWTVCMHARADVSLIGVGTDGHGELNSLACTWKPVMYLKCACVCMSFTNGCDELMNTTHSHAHMECCECNQGRMCLYALDNEVTLTLLSMYGICRKCELDLDKAWIWCLKLTAKHNLLEHARYGCGVLKHQPALQS